MSIRSYSVEQVVSYIKNRLESDHILNNLHVKGEISNFIHHSSGHFYFTLKDENASIPCVMFNSYARKVAFRPKDGSKVILSARVSLYEKTGRLQLYVTEMNEDGLGDLYQRFEELKKRLHEEGYFNAEHKKPLVRYPFSIALISGRDTAACSDVHTTLKRRWPVAAVVDYYSLVQGEAAVPEIISQLLSADKNHHDVIILARGGGSLEDLWCFNDERVVKTIYSLHTPVITGIGHEVDFTLADFVADVRANTPTGAAEIAAPLYSDVLFDLHDQNKKLERMMMQKLSLSRKDMDHLISYELPKLSQSIIQKPSIALMMHYQTLSRYPYSVQQKYAISLLTKKNDLMSYEHLLKENRNAFDASIRSLLHKGEVLLNRSRFELNRKCDRMIAAEENRFMTMRGSFEHSESLLSALSPVEILKRGYAIVEKEEKVVRSVSNIKEKDQLHIRVADGVFKAEVTDKE